MQFPAYLVGSRFENYLMRICFSAVRLFISDLGNVSEQAYISFPTLFMFLGDHFFPDLGYVFPQCAYLFRISEMCPSKLT